jgi:hypothetical protein
VEGVEINLIPKERTLFSRTPGEQINFGMNFKQTIDNTTQYINNLWVWVCDENYDQCEEIIASDSFMPSWYTEEGYYTSLLPEWAIGKQLVLDMYVQSIPVIYDDDKERNSQAQTSAFVVRNGMGQSKNNIVGMAGVGLFIGLLGWGLARIYTLYKSFLM